MDAETHGPPAAGSGRGLLQRPGCTEHLDDVLKDDAEAVAYLHAALEDNEPQVFLLAVRDVARAREGGLGAVAEATQRNREHLYRMLSEKGNPERRSLEALLDPLGLRLRIESKAAS